MAIAEGDLGFTFNENKKGEVIIHHVHKLAATLRNNKAVNFMDDIDRSSFKEQQILMARITGKYKFGNERMAKNHIRNKR